MFVTIHYLVSLRKIEDDFNMNNTIVTNSREKIKDYGITIEELIFK